MKPTLAELEAEYERVAKIPSGGYNQAYVEGQISIMKEWHVEEMYELLIVLKHRLEMDWGDDIHGLENDWWYMKICELLAKLDKDG